MRSARFLFFAAALWVETCSLVGLQAAEGPPPVLPGTEPLVIELTSESRIRR